MGRKSSGSSKLKWFKASCLIVPQGHLPSPSSLGVLGTCPLQIPGMGIRLALADRVRAALGGVRSSRNLRLMQLIFLSCVHRTSRFRGKGVKAFSSDMIFKHGSSYWTEQLVWGADRLSKLTGVQFITWCPFLEASILEGLVSGEALKSLSREPFKTLFCYGSRCRCGGKWKIHKAD